MKIDYIQFPDGTFAVRDISGDFPRDIVCIPTEMPPWIQEAIRRVAEYAEEQILREREELEEQLKDRIEELEEKLSRVIEKIKEAAEIIGED